MNGKSVHSIVPLVPDVRAVQDEWGSSIRIKPGSKPRFGPCVRWTRRRLTTACWSAVRGDEPALTLPELAARVAGSGCRARSRGASRPGAARRRRRPDRARAADPTARQAAERGAVYSLEFPTRCPQCCTEISTVRVSRLLRTQVSFTSTLPRKGYIIVCPRMRRHSVGGAVRVDLTHTGPYGVSRVRRTRSLSPDRSPGVGGREARRHAARRATAGT